MRLTPEQLAKHLTKDLLPMYLISGDEILLAQEARDMIREAARKKGIQQRHNYEATKDFDWNNFLISASNHSLFDDKILLEIRINTFNAAAKDALVTYATHPAADKVVVITTGKLDKNAQNASWFQTLSKVGAMISIWPLDISQFRNWLSQRLNKVSLNVQSEGIRLLAEYTEGNLLAAAQEIEKLRLLFGKESPIISEQQIMAAIGDNARFDVFTFSDAVLQGNAPRALRILQRLDEEGTEAPLILWALTREIRQLIKLQHLLDKGISPNAAFQQLRVREKHQPLLKKILKTNKLIDIYQIILHASEIDCMIKGALTGNVLDEIKQLTLSLTR